MQHTHSSGPDSAPFADTWVGVWYASGWALEPVRRTRNESESRSR